MGAAVTEVMSGPSGGAIQGRSAGSLAEAGERASLLRGVGSEAVAWQRCPSVHPAVGHLPIVCPLGMAGARRRSGGRPAARQGPS